MPQLRIVSLIASATEMVAALGLTEQLVGRSHECDFPADVMALPICSEAKIDVSGTSREIDERVKSLAGQAISVYRVVPDVLRAVRPTHIITQTQCEVCAVSLADVEAAVCELLDCRPEIVALEPMCLEDVFHDVLRLGRALGVESRARELAQSLRSRLNDISDRVRTASRPSIGCIEWIDPLMAAGNWVPELVDLAGGQNLLGVAGRHSPWLTVEELAARDPEIIAVMPCGFDIARTRAEMPPLVRDPRWNTLRSVRGGRVYLTDGNQYFNRPGPRLVESARILAEILHPEIFDNSLEHVGWTRFP